MYRVYLAMAWREFAIDYPTNEAAELGAESFRKAFPGLRYSIRRTPLSLSEADQVLHHLYRRIERERD
jgi:hypothetical protein